MGVSPQPWDAEVTECVPAALKGSSLLLDSSGRIGYASVCEVDWLGAEIPCGKVIFFQVELEESRVIAWPPQAQTEPPADPPHRPLASRLMTGRPLKGQIFPGQHRDLPGCNPDQGQVGSQHPSGVQASEG